MLLTLMAVSVVWGWMAPPAPPSSAVPTPTARPSVERVADVTTPREIPPPAKVASAGNSPSDPPSPPAGNATLPAKVPASDEACRALLIGEWQDDYHGHRHLVVRADGTGTMVSQLEGYAATFFAKRLEFHIRWQVAEGHVSFVTTGGKPATKAALVLRMYGASRRHPILELNDQRMVLQDDDGEIFTWTRLPASPP